MAKKNANGDGSHSRKRPDGRYEARYWVETTTGRKRRSVYSNTSKECAQNLRHAMAAKDDSPVFVAPDIEVIEFFRQYEEVAKGTMKRRSFETCRDITRLHLLPSLGNRKLKDLTRVDIQSLYSHKRKGGLSAASVQRIHDVLSSALNRAVKWRLIEHNPCKEVSPPRVPAPEVRPFSKEEAKLLLSAAESDRYHALYVLGVTSGAR